MYDYKRFDLNPARLSVFAFLQLKKLFLETTYKKKTKTKFSLFSGLLYRPLTSSVADLISER